MILLAKRARITTQIIHEIDASDLIKKEGTIILFHIYQNSDGTVYKEELISPDGKIITEGTLFNQIKKFIKSLDQE